MQPHGSGRRYPEELFNGGGNDLQDVIARALEESGVPHNVAVMIGHWYMVLVVIVMIFVFVAYFGWIGKKRRPPKKKGKKH